MKTYRLDLNSIEKVKGFVSAISNMEGYFDLVSGRYVVDAKSIMGIFSLDLSRALTLIVHADDEKSAGFLEEADKFIVK